MKTTMLTLMTLLVLAPLSAADQNIDSGHSFLWFKVSHLEMGYTLGQFRDIKGHLDPEAGSVEITVRADSVDTNDAKRDEHIKGPDFFNVKQFPVLRFTGKKVEKVAAGKYRVTGQLLLHGRKQEITVDLARVGGGKDPWGNQREGYEARFIVNRGDYGMSYGPGMVGETVEIHFAAETIRK